MLLTHSKKLFTASAIETIIIVFAFNRPSHTERTIRALLENDFCEMMPIRVHVDGPRNAEEAIRTAQVAKTCRELGATHGIEVIEAPANLGLYASITSGISAALQDFSQVIILEDDIVTSKHFLSYMLQGLQIYRDDLNVASLHGYLPPVKKKLPETFFLRGADCWGWATWKDRWSQFRSDAGAMALEIRQRGLTEDFNLNGNYDYIGMLESCAKGDINSWAICWHASCFLANKLTLYPGRSLVENIGLDFSGVHCGPSSLLEAKLTKKKIRVTRLPTIADKKVATIYANHFHSSPTKKNFAVILARKIKSFLRILLNY